jgi:XTP/dITP diphosphohydrolase
MTLSAHRSFILATRNQHKFQELKTVAGGSLKLIQCPANCPPAAESASTYEGNARIKAVLASDFTGFAAIGDDTGIEVDALEGGPGVRSARYAGASENSRTNCAKMLMTLREVDQDRRTARYRTVLVTHFPDGREVISEGMCEGLIAPAPRGPLTFGYQALFIPFEGDGCTFAEMKLDQRIRISHHARALRALIGTLGGLAK